MNLQEWGVLKAHRNDERLSVTRQPDYILRSRHGRHSPDAGQGYSKSQDADFFSPFSERFERYNAVLKGENSVVLAKPRVRAGMKLGSLLSHQYVTGAYLLTGESLHSESLTGTVPAVS